MNLGKKTKTISIMLIIVSVLVSSRFVSNAFDEFGTLGVIIRPNCTASVRNRTIPVSPDGAFTIFNVPAEEGLIKVRMVCSNGTMRFGGETFLVRPNPDSITFVGQLPVSGLTRTVNALELLATKSTLATIGNTAQLAVTATFDDGTSEDVRNAPDTVYTTSNPNIVTINNTGLVTAVSDGPAIVSASKDGVIATLLLQVSTGPTFVDTDGDGMPDDFELANGLNPNDPTDAGLDPDTDGLTNLQEFQTGTNPQVADSDGDGLLDGAEITQGTNPLLGDTDGDGLFDGPEIILGTNPLNSDTDGDFLPDGSEVTLGLSPLLIDTDGDGIVDGDEDTDGDQLSNRDEVALGSDPNNPDTDGDTIQDGREVSSGCDLLVPETTTVVGRTVDELGNPLGGVEVRTLVATGVTDAQGQFSLFPHPACPTQTLRVVAVGRVRPDDTRLQGLSSAVFSVLGGTANVGDIILRSRAAFLYPGIKFRVGNGPSSVAISDLNLDGISDLVATNGDFRSKSVSVLLGNGDGTFQIEQRFDTGFNPKSVAVADLNLDGIPDLVTANSGSDDVSTLLGNGDGTFQIEQRFAAGIRPFSVAVADLNLDGIPDLVATNAGSFADNAVSVLLGNGNGTFQPRQRFSAGGRPVSVAVADLNLDGIPDLVTANFIFNDVSVLLGNGDGTFQPQQRFAVGTFGSFVISVAAADVNLDGIPDLVTANFGPNDVSVLLGNGDGTFQIRQRFTVGTDPRSVAVADLNLDGIPDLVTANGGSNDVSVLLGNGDGTFQIEQRFATGSFPTSVAVAQAVAVADLNLDGIPDLATANGRSDDVSVLLGNGDGTFPAPKRFAVGTFPTSVAVADLNLDGIPDLVTANFTSNDVSVLLGNGDGTFPTQQRFTAGTVPRSVAVADLNLDGIPDLVTANFFSNDVSVLLGNGDGTFQPQQRFTAGTSPRSVAVADVNLDGIPDLVTVNGSFSSSDVSVLLGNGNGTFLAPQRFAVGPRGTLSTSLAVTDLNLDGIPDLVTANSGPNDVSVLLGNGDGTFQPQQRFTVGTSPQSVAVADVNLDGIPDLVTANSGLNDVSVLLGNGNGTFQSERSFAVGTRPSSVTVADLNLDGFPDLVTANSGSNDVSVLLHQ